MTFPASPEETRFCVPKSHGTVLNPKGLRYPYDDKYAEYYYTDYSYYACIPLGANHRDEDPQVAADLYCQEMVNQGLVGPGAVSTDYDRSNPVCSYGMFGASWCTGIRLGSKDQVEIDHPGETHPGMPRHEDIFMRIVCSPPADCGASPADSMTIAAANTAAADNPIGATIV